MDTLLVIIIIAVAVGYIVLRARKSLSGKGGSGCGCEGCSCNGQDCKD